MSRRASEDHHAKGKAGPFKLRGQFTEGVSLRVPIIDTLAQVHDRHDLDAGAFATRCYERGVHMLPNDAHGMRAVTHRDVPRGDVVTALGVIASVLT